jgi:hypothetical protein
MDAQPEVAMNIQIAKQEETYAVVVAGRIAIAYDEAIVAQLSRLNEVLGSSEGVADSYAERLERWTEGLQTSQPITPIPVEEALVVLGFIHFGPRSPLPRTPWRPSYVYGHLPFHGMASGNDIFHRYEAYPTSRRIDLKTNGVIKPDTYASPGLDAAYVNSGSRRGGEVCLASTLARALVLRTQTPRWHNHSLRCVRSSVRTIGRRC